jgi:hypothetical protein
LRQTAFSLDAVLLELAYAIGPAAIALTIAVASARAAMALAFVFAVLAAPLLALSGALRWWTPEPAGARSLLGPLTEPRLLRVYAATFALTLAFGALEVGYPAFGRAAGADSWGPALIAFNSIGSALGGLVYGGAHLKAPLARQLPVLMALLAVPLAGHLPIATPWPLVPLAFAAGALIAPAMTAVALLVANLAPARHATEAFTWSSTAIVTGVGGGMMAGGALVERFGANGAFGLAIAAVLVAAAIALPLKRAP